MVRAGVLGPAVSGEFIADHAKHVSIHEEGLAKLTKKLLSSLKEGKLQIPDTGTDDIRPSKNYPCAVDWVFVADSLNFCFWSFPDSPKWTVAGHSGYYALEAALYRAIKEGKDVTNPEYYSKITEEELRYIMRGDNEAQIPLFNERLTVLHEVGSTLLQKHNGTFETLLKQANKSATKLLSLIVENFPCFRDEATYNDKVVSFYKRAQILVSDLWSFFDGAGWGEFEDVDTMTMFADYRVPQVLAYFGAISYSKELMDKLRNNVLLPSGSEEEIEIRGCSIHAVELLKKRVESELQPGAVNSSLIDYYLWCYRRKHCDVMEDVPFHKTYGIFY